MNWTNLKTILIYFLIGMNIFLIICMAIFTHNENAVPDDVLQAACTLLRDDGFEIEPDALPDSYISLPVINASFYSPSELSDIFFGKQLPFRTKGDSLIASEGGATLTVNLNSFSYENGNSIQSASPGKIKRKLKKAGINMQGAVYDEKTGYFYRMYKGYNLFNMYIKASLDDNGNICQISAQWPSTLSAQAAQRFSFTKHVPTLKEKFKTRGKIQNIECGYELKLIGGNKYVFMPSWRVAVGRESIILNIQ